MVAAPDVGWMAPPAVLLVSGWLVCFVFHFRRVFLLPSFFPSDSRSVFVFLTNIRLYDKIKNCYRHRPPFAGFSARQVPRWSLTCTR